MKKNIQIAVPKPCHEKWDSFTTTSNGGFCDSCQKEVIDFTSWSDERIQLYFKNLKGKACGRFREGQLQVRALDGVNITAPRWFPMIIAGGLLLFRAPQVVAQQRHDFAHHPSEQGIEVDSSKTISKTPSLIIVSGVVTSPEEGLPMPGVNVVLKGSAVTTVTDQDGKFSLTLKPSTTAPVLVFSFIGFTTVEYTLSAVHEHQEVNVEMFFDQEMLNEKIIVGGCYVMRWYDPRTWWWRIRSVFSY